MEYVPGKRGRQKSPSEPVQESRIKPSILILAREMGLLARSATTPLSPL